VPGFYVARCFEIISLERRTTTMNEKGLVRCETKDFCLFKTYDFTELKEKPPMERKFYMAEVKEYDDQDLTVTHFISTEVRDRGGDVLKADGMKIRGKVVVLFAHGQSSYGQEPIGKPLRIWPDTFKGSRGICARTQFYDGSHLNPPDSTGKRLYEKCKEGFLPNWSIGWIPLKWEDHASEGQRGRNIFEWELLEYSPVGVPMNPDATNFDSAQSALSYKALGDKREPPKVMVHLGDGKFCKLEDLASTLSKKLADFTIRIFRQKYLGKVD
jgi:hypothetical protein